MASTTTSTAALDDYADVSNPEGEPIAVWERVSTDMTRQEIAAQTRDLRAFVGAGSYNVVRVFRFEASAFHGKHAPAQAEMLSDIEGGRYKTVVSAMTSRYERRGVKHALRFALDLDLYGARVVAIDDPSYGDMDSELGIIGTVFKAKSNYDYSKSISDNVNRVNRLRDEQNVFRGAIPGGYEAVGPTGAKQLVKHPVGAAAVVAAFIDSAEGKSTPKIARTFKAENDRHNAALPEGAKKLRLPVTADGVANLLRHPIYSTGEYTVNRGDGIAYVYKCEPLVSPAQQRNAVAALGGRRKGDNVSSRAIAKDDLSGALYCGACGEHGKMYRVYGGGKPRKDGTPAPRVRRYICTVCKKSVHADNADEAVNADMRADVQPWWIPRSVDPNAERDRAIAEVEAELKALPTLGLDEDDEDARRVVLRAKRRELREIPDAEITTYADPKTDEHGRRLTEGDRWAQMTPAERRDLLTGGSVTALVRAAAGRTGAVVVEIQRERDTDDE